MTPTERKVRWLQGGALGIGLGVLTAILGAHTEGALSGALTGMSTLFLYLAFYCLGRGNNV